MRGRHFSNMTILVLLSGLLASQRQVAMISEMIHSASLVHDDVVDQADFRRGKPSVNVLWNHKKVGVAYVRYSLVSTQRFFCQRSCFFRLFFFCIQLPWSVFQSRLFFKDISPIDSLLGYMNGH